MLDLNAIQDLKKIVTHGGCSDGTASALLIKDALPRVEIEFLYHGSEQFNNLQPEPGMLFVDISPPRDRVHEFVDAGALILDHHKGSKDIIEAFGSNGFFGDENLNPGVSGAVLAYEHIWHQINGYRNVPCELAKTFAELIGIRDTWDRRNPRWKEANILSSAVSFYPVEYWFERLARDDFFTPSLSSDKFWKDVEELGSVLWGKRENTVAFNAKKSYEFITKSGTRCVTFERTDLSSDMAEFYDDKKDLVIGFSFSCENNIPYMNFSTRSHTNFDCCGLAQSHGGGGHSRAAGFRIQMEAGTLNPYTKVCTVIEQFEERGKSVEPVE